MASQVARIFDIIPRLQHIHRCKDLSELQTWHAKHRFEDGMVRSVLDSDAMHHIERKWPEFNADPRNVRLAASSDGFSPHGHFGLSTYTMWPVMLVNYNLPPSLAIKREHIILSVLIPGIQLLITPFGDLIVL